MLKEDLYWDHMFKQVKEYVELHNDFPSKKDDKSIKEYRLYHWAAQQRSKRKNTGDLSKYKIDKLDSINFPWDIVKYKWNKNFDLLKEYLKYNNDYPTKENKRLFTWVSYQRHHVHKLSSHQIEKLNSIDFVWSLVQLKWNNMFKKFITYAETNQFPPHKGFHDMQLVKWYKLQLNYIKDGGKLTNEQTYKFNKINNLFQGTAKQAKWFELFTELVEFRKENPNRWPTYDRTNLNSPTNKLYIFSQSMRKYYQNGSLGSFWENKLKEIEFNFERTLAKKWITTFNVIKDKVKNKDNSGLTKKEENWVKRYVDLYHKEQLSEFKREKIEQLDISRFTKESWIEKFEKVRCFVEQYEKLPTKNTHKKFHSWLSSQRSRYNNGNLTKIQIKHLESINFKLIPDGNKKREEDWMNSYDQYKIFQSKYNREPKYSVLKEKKLYLWVQAQRAVYSGSARGRLPLSPKRKSLLDSINFSWRGKGISKFTWEERFQQLTHYLKNNQKIKPVINGKYSDLYRWLSNQKLAYKRGPYSEKRLKKLKDIGIDLKAEKEFNDFKEDAQKLADFVKANGVYPTRNQEVQLSLVHERLKIEYKENKLSLDQLELLSSLGLI